MTYNNKSTGERSVDIGGLAFGYNIVLNERIELINQLYVDIPQRNESAAWSLMFGFIATLP